MQCGRQRGRSQEDLATVHVSPFFPASCRSRKNLLAQVSVTPTTSEQSFHTFTSSPRTRVFMGDGAWTLESLLAGSGRPAGKAASVGVLGHVLLGQTNLFLLKSAEVLPWTDEPTCTNVGLSGLCRKSRFLVGLEGNVACLRVQLHVWSPRENSRKPGAAGARASL